MTIYDDIQSAEKAISTINETLKTIEEFRDLKAAEIGKYLRVGKSGIELDPEAIRQTPLKPYTLIPINQHEAWMVQWAGIKMPIFGYVVARDGVFIKSRVSRSMDLITPFPKSLKDEMGWKDPEHKVTIDSSYTGVHILEGEEDSFKKKYGAYLGGKVTGKQDGTAAEYKIRGGDAWIKLVSALIKDGILPYAPKPVDKAHWNPKAKLEAGLLAILEKLNWKEDRKYIERAVNEWKMTGAMLFNIPPGGGKSLIFYIILTYFIGKVLLFADTTPLVEKWEKALQELCPNANVTVSTYQGAQKYKDQEWDLILFDEAQRLPANSFSKLAFFKTHYRAGATGTAWREDDRQHLIVALCGKPFYIPWEELIAAGVMKKPRITVSIVKNESAKIGYVKSLVSKRKGKALIYCDWLQRGNEFANALNVPFVSGDSKHKLQTIEESEVTVVTRIADRGLSFQDIRLVIEVAFAGKSREQFGQRVGRLLHGDFEGHFYTVFTPDEYESYKSRILGVELELAGEVDIEYLYIGDVKESDPVRTPKKRVGAVKAITVKKAKPEKVLDEVDQFLNLVTVKSKLELAGKSRGRDFKIYAPRVMRYCWNRSLSPQQIADGLAMTGKNAIAVLRSTCIGLTDANLMISGGDGKFIVNRKYLDELKELSQLRKR